MRERIINVKIPSNNITKPDTKNARPAFISPSLFEELTNVVSFPTPSLVTLPSIGSERNQHSSVSHFHFISVLHYRLCTSFLNITLNVFTFKAIWATISPIAFASNMASF